MESFDIVNCCVLKHCYMTPLSQQCIRLSLCLHAQRDSTAAERDFNYAASPYEEYLSQLPWGSVALTCL